MKENQSKVLTDELLKGDRIALSKAITIIESQNINHRVVAEEILNTCLSKAGNSVRIGITGVPGVGKSTFIEVFGNYLIEKHNLKVAVLAIDPSSQTSKGSILGDKTRMHSLSQNKNAYIRPSPTSGNLGGVAASTRETILLCEAAGFDVILIETVGVGQSETEVGSMVDFFLLLMLAGAGDELQGMKRGIMELADLVVIHKAEEGNLTAAKQARIAYRNALHLFPAKDSGWSPKVTVASSLDKFGHEEVWKSIKEYIAFTKENGFFEFNRNEQAIHWMNGVVKATLQNEFFENSEIQKVLKDFENKVRAGEISPGAAANKLIEVYRKSK